MKDHAIATFDQLEPIMIKDVPVLTGIIDAADAETLRELADRFRASHPSSAVVLATETDGKPLIIAALSKDLVARGLHAGELVKAVAEVVGGGGGGKPSLAQAGGKHAEKLDDALAIVTNWVQTKLK